MARRGADSRVTNGKLRAGKPGARPMSVASAGWWSDGAMQRPSQWHAAKTSPLRCAGGGARHRSSRHPRMPKGGLRIWHVWHPRSAFQFRFAHATPHAHNSKIRREDACPSPFAACLRGASRKHATSGSRRLRCSVWAAGALRGEPRLVSRPALCRCATQVANASAMKSGTP